MNTTLPQTLRAVLPKGTLVQPVLWHAQAAYAGEMYPGLYLVLLASNRFVWAHRSDPDLTLPADLARCPETVAWRAE